MMQIRDILEDIKEDLPPPPPLFMSGCGCWKLQARLDLYMLGQCLLDDAMLLRSAALLSTDSRWPLLPSARRS